MTDTVSRRSALRLLGGAITVAATATGGLTTPVHALDRPEAGAGPRVESLIGRLTLDEKISLLHGATDPNSLGQAGYVPGVPRLNIPPLRLADGPAGVRVTRHATALPAPVLLASAFDPELARRYGRVIGREGRALGQDVLLSPMVNLIRTPYAGRNFETFSEDPLLASGMVAAEIEGIQGEGLIATVKHYAMNNQEQDRMSVDVRVDEQTMHELELRGFEAAVVARTGAVMGAYNKVNGTFACENRTLLTDVLREQWGFEGWVMTDWFAAHSTVAAITAGLDMEMPDGTYFGTALRSAVQNGTVPERYVDRAVRRILTVMDRFGLLDGSAPPRPDRDAPASAAVALEIAEAGATLLRNERRTLPLARGGSLAVIGPTGALPFVSGGGSAHVVPDHADSPLDALKSRAGKLTYALGEDLYGKAIPASALDPAFDSEGQQLAAGQVWTYDGTLTVPEDDEWTFVLHFSSAPTARPKVLLDGTELFPQAPGYGEFFTGGLVSAAPDGLSVRRGTLTLAKGAHTLRITAQGGAGGLTFRLRRSTGATRAQDVAEAVAAARAARDVVLFAYEDATEGLDRTTIALPGHQTRLIEAVTAANPRTTVVLNTSSSTSMPWLGRTGAVLQMYYPGQEGAAATAAVLYGECDPGGRLTQSFPADDDHHPVAGDPRRYPGVDGTEEYSEGIHAGYRWYDAEGVRPLFPFGHGLSYTSFSYADLRARRTRHGIEVTFTVRNTGRREGIAVPQVYVGPSPRLRLEQAVRVLAGYRRLALRAGERRRVTVDVTARTLSSWDPARHTWVLGTGRRTVWVGTSSRELRLRTNVEVGR
ncbi:glycoside hydrolase family 3 C-terminal domain-containing protein [Streptomyces spinosirectus]|uniref:beta-glucosidase family protein n=1 Tax=Streptomyces TaxID=1883 RepID=UPI001C9DA1E4|nr:MULTISPECIES: glycoside hydrolase family 3 N-terminal domain-containing protein [Streptomyces]MBY8342048.1 glycoside hydrolase family 3 C-terminal domain-containing protein [Streptomyces plumbidurans]UIR16607.1 glycoside hydrolase family 3 C-terminal domain-containing protein [Streptomyces spinosirectus]